MDIERVLEVEKKYHLYEKKIDDINYWIYTRDYICRQYFPYLQGKMPKKIHYQINNPIDFIKKVPEIVINICFRGWNKVKCADICIIDHERRIWENGKYECKYTKKLFDYFEKDAIILERPYNFGHLRPIAEKGIVYLDYVSALCYLYTWFVKSFMRQKYKNIYLQIKEQTQEPLTELVQYYNVECSLDVIYQKITENILMNRMRKSQVRRLLKRIQPKVIIEVVGYDPVCMVANELAHEMGIATYELQHGHITEALYPYNYDAQGKILQFADYFLTFGEYYKNDIKYPIDDEHVIAVGFPYLEEKARQLKKSGKARDRKNILFISQGIGGAQLAQLASRLAELIEKKGANYEVIYKLHPGEYLVWKEKYAELYCASKKSLIQVIDTQKSDLYQLLSEADIQIGVNSTAIIEGMIFGLTTMIYNIEYCTIMKCLYNNNFAWLVNNEEEILNILDSKETLAKDTGSDFFWKQNAIDNMIKVIAGDN